jgi:hypothetical protein
MVEGDARLTTASPSSSKIADLAYVSALQVRTIEEKEANKNMYYTVSFYTLSSLTQNSGKVPPPHLPTNS